MPECQKIKRVGFTGLQRPKFYGSARSTLIGAVASAAGSGHVVNLSFWLNRDVPRGVVDNQTLMFSSV